MELVKDAEQMMNVLVVLPVRAISAQLQIVVLTQIALILNIVNQTIHVKMDAEQIQIAQCPVMLVRTIPALILNAVKILIVSTLRFVTLTTSVRRDAEMIQCALALMLCVIFSTPTAITAIIQQTKLDSATQVFIL